MAGRARGDVLQSPYVSEFYDYVMKVIRITVNFNNATRQITGATLYRDADCVFTRILIGLGPDGTPDTTETAIAVPAGTTAMSAQDLAALGFTTIEQILAQQITASP